VFFSAWFWYRQYLGHPLKGTSQGKKVPRGNEISIALPSNG
jgi:hypothetical protein